MKIPTEAVAELNAFTKYGTAPLHLVDMNDQVQTAKVRRTFLACRFISSTV